jgi:hypothetical protein
MPSDIDDIREQLKTGNLLMCEAVKQRGYVVDPRILAKQKKQDTIKPSEASPASEQEKVT